jgi:hypothetical protein
MKGPACYEFQVLLRAQTVSGPWAYSLHVSAGERAQAEHLSREYLWTILALGTPIETLTIRRVYTYASPVPPAIIRAKGARGNFIGG